MACLLAKFKGWKQAYDLEEGRCHKTVSSEVWSVMQYMVNNIRVSRERERDGGEEVVLPVGVLLLGRPGTAWLAQALPSCLFHFVTAQSCFVEGEPKAGEEHVPGSLRDD